MTASSEGMGEWAKGLIKERHAVEEMNVAAFCDIKQGSGGFPPRTPFHHGPIAR